MLNLSAVNDTKDVATKEYVDGKAVVTGVKGNSESSYRTGNVNLTAANIGAAASSHTHSTQQLYYPSYLAGMSDVALRPMVDTTRANRLAFLPADQIIIEKTTDGGTTWVDAGVADATKAGLFAETRAGVALPLLNGTTRSNLCGLRITITAMKYTVPSGTAETAKYSYWTTANVTSQERYTNLDSMYFWLGSNGDKIGVKVECANASTPTTWITCFDNPSFGLVGWSGNSYISFSNRAFGGGTNQTGQPWNWRITLMTMYANGSSAYSNTAQSIMEIRGYGSAWWGGQNNYMKNDHLYSWDYQLNATFPKQLTATQFNGALNGTATTATNVSGAAASSNTTARHIWFSDSATETKRAYSDSCTYVSSTNTISTNISGNAATATSATTLSATLSADKGGTGQTTLKAAANSLLNNLETGSSTPVDADYYISQYVGGGTTTTTYHRRPMSALWSYISGKISSVLGLTSSQYGGNAATATNADKVNNLTVQTAVPANAVFTDTKNTAGSTNSTSKLFLIGATTNGSSATNPQTYSNSNVYATNGALQATTYNGLTLTKASTGFTIAGGTTSKTLTVNNTYTLAAACAKGVDTSMTSTSTSTNLPTTKAVVDYVNSQSSVTGADYITEQGTSNGWVYRKWNSGIAECWGNFSHSSVSISSKSGNAWYSGEIYETFPSSLFNASPSYCDVSANPNAGVSFEVASGLSSTRTQAIYLMRLESSATVSVWLQIHAIGTWK